MLQLTHSKSPIRVGAPRRRDAAVAGPRAQTPALPAHPNAAPLTLLAVVVGGELLAVAMAIVTALGV